MKECGFDSRSAHHKHRSVKRTGPKENLTMNEIGMSQEWVKSKIIEVGPCRKAVEVEVAAVEAEKEFDAVLKKYAARAKLPGFRPGKVPQDMVRRLFLAEIKDSVVDSLAPKALAESLHFHRLNPVTTPVIEDVDFKEGFPLRFRASFEVWPDFDLPQYKKVRVPARTVEVSEEEVDRAVEELRQRAAEYIPAEGREVAAGDYAVVDLQGKDLKTKRLLPAEKLLILAGNPENEKALDENLMGLNPGETRRFSFSYPKDYPDTKRAGKDIEYDLKVISIKEKRLPEMGDDFAKALDTEVESLADLREKVRKGLKTQKERLAKRDTAEDVVKNISDRLAIEFPPSIVEQEAVAVMKDVLSTAGRVGLKPEETEELKRHSLNQAEQKLKRHLILREIASREGLTVSEDEVEQEVGEIARANNMPLARVVASLDQEGWRENLKNSLVLRKAIDFLVENAIIE